MFASANIWSQYGVSSLIVFLLWSLQLIPLVKWTCLISRTLLFIGGTASGIFVTISIEKSDKSVDKLERNHCFTILAIVFPLMNAISLNEVECVMQFIFIGASLPLNTDSITIDPTLAAFLFFFFILLLQRMKNILPFQTFLTNCLNRNFFFSR